MAKGKNKKQKRQDNEEKVQTKQQGDNQEQEQSENQVEIVQPKKVQYCPVCTLPFELCKYGKKVKECKKLLQEIAPTKVQKYHPAGNTNVGEDDKKQEQIDAPKQKSKKDKTLREKYIVITVKERTKKKFVTTVSGLLIFKIDAKQLTKKLSKKFACSCSVIDPNQIQIQGDFEEDMREMLKEDYGVRKKYILGKDQFKQKQTQEKEKKKADKNALKDVIPEEPEQQQQKKLQQVETKPKFKTQFQAALADMSDQEDDQ